LNLLFNSIDKQEARGSHQDGKSVQIGQYILVPIPNKHPQVTIPSSSMHPLIILSSLPDSPFIILQEINAMFFDPYLPPL
jgi:hypothetical protein